MYEYLQEVSTYLNFPTSIKKQTVCCGSWTSGFRKWFLLSLSKIDIVKYHNYFAFIQLKRVNFQTRVKDTKGKLKLVTSSKKINWQRHYDLKTIIQTTVHKSQNKETQINTNISNTRSRSQMHRKGKQISLHI